MTQDREMIVRARVGGRVQGVGYRAWTQREAAARGLRGWVRNRSDGSVEAVFAGDPDAVAAMVEGLPRGPHGAAPAGIELRRESEDALGQEGRFGFAILATV